jgi:HEAT repeat protein
VLAVLVAAAAYFLAFVPYGFYLEDEGTMLYQIARTHAGEIPYIDFHTGYTPGLFYVNAWLFDAFGVDVIALRIGLALVNALAAALLFALTRRVAPPAWAFVATLVYVAFLPFFGGEFASFNIPYPSWYVTLLWIVSTLLLVRYRETGRWRDLLLAGVAAGGCFCFKPNGGAFALAAGGLGILVLRSADGVAQQRLAAAGCAAFGLAVAALFGFSLLSFETAIFTLPWLVLALGLARRPAPAAHRPVSAVIAEGAILGVGFALPTLPWLVWLKLRMPTSEFLREVLLIGGDVQQVYSIPYPLPEWWALALAVALVALAAVPLALGRGFGTRRGIGWSAGIASGVALVAFALFARMPEGLALSIIWQLENAAFYLVPLSLMAAVVWLVRTRGAETGAAALVVVSGLAMLEQMNPRPDFMHLIMGVPVAVAVVAFVGARVAADWRGVGGVGRLVAGTLLVVPLVVGALRVGSNLGRPVGMDRVTGAVAFGVEASVGQDLASLARVVEFISARTRADEPVFGFPAMAAVNFLTGRPNPVRHDYFFPGRPAHSEEARVVAELAAVRPAYVVTLNDRFGFFQEAPTYYFLLRDYLRRAYTLELRAGRYDVLRRRDLPAEAAEMAAAPPDAVAAAAGLADLEALARVGGVGDVPRLLEALRRVHRSLRARVTEAIMAVAARNGGLLPMIRGVQPSERDELMLVRSLGEFGDTRALDYLTARFADQPTRRMRSETGRALAFVTARLLAASHVLSGPPPPEEAFAVTVPAETLVAWLEDTKLRRRVGAYAAIVLGRTGHRETVPLLRSLLGERKQGWLQASVARALVDLDAPDAPCDLTTLLESPQLAVQTHVPNMLLELGARRPADVRRCLATALADDEEPVRRESVAWIAGVLRDDGLVAPLAQVASSDDGPARLAALWALGEIGDARAASAVTAALGSDDALVRDFAGEAERKLARSTVPPARAGG